MGKRNGEPRGTGFEPPPEVAPALAPPPPVAPPAPLHTGVHARRAVIVRVTGDLWQSVGLLGGGGALMLVGSMLAVIHVTWSPDWNAIVWVTGLALLLSGALVTVMGMSAARTEAGGRDERGRSQSLYHRFLVGLGFLLFGVSLLAVTGFAGMLHSDQIPANGAAFAKRLLDNTAATPEAAAGTPAGRMLAVMLLVSAALALVGASFFVTGAMREHQGNNLENPEVESFDESRFWGGLWFRLGQAVLYTLVFFIVLWSGLPGTGNGEGAITGSMVVMPVVGLLIGMFVKAGEALVAGVAERILNAVSALVGPAKK